jgi:hypothetical protein
MKQKYTTGGPYLVKANDPVYIAARAQTNLANELSDFNSNIVHVVKLTKTNVTLAKIAITISLLSFFWAIVSFFLKK